MNRDECVHVQLRKVARVELVQLAMIEDSMSVEQLGFTGGAEPVLLFKVEHKARGAGMGEPIHLAMPASIAALMVGQIDAMVQDVFNDAERAHFDLVRLKTLETCREEIGS